MHSLPVEDLEDVVPEPGNRTPAVPVLRTRLRSSLPAIRTCPPAQDLQRASQSYGAGSLGRPYQAARWYSWISPPSTSTRSIGPVREVVLSGATGASRPMPRC